MKNTFEKTKKNYMFPIRIHKLSDLGHQEFKLITIKTIYKYIDIKYL